MRAELGEVRLRAGAPAQVGHAVVAHARRSTLSRRASSSAPVTTAFGMRGTAAGDYVPSASSNCALASTNAGSVTSARDAGPREVDEHVGRRPVRARRHHDDAVGEQQRLLDVVRDEHDRATVARPHLLQPLLHRAAGDRVERAERLVEQQHGPRDEERAQQRDPLPHASRQRRPATRVRTRRARTGRAGRAARARASCASTPATSAPSVAFASTLRHGISRSCCGWYATSPGSRSRDSPTVAMPRVGATSPATIRSSVDLPQPLGPTTATNCPCRDVEVDRARSRRPGELRRRCGRCRGDATAAPPLTSGRSRSCRRRRRRPVAASSPASTRNSSNVCQVAGSCVPNGFAVRL